MMFSFRVAEPARGLMTPKSLGLAVFSIPNDEGKWKVNTDSRISPPRGRYAPRRQVEGSGWLPQVLRNANIRQG